MKDNFSVRNWKNNVLYKESYNSSQVNEANEDYDLLKIKKDIRFHLDAYEAGTIDGDDLAQAVEEVVFGAIVAPGMNTDADFEREQMMQMGMREEDEPSARDIAAAEKDLEFEIPTATSDSSNMRNVIVKKVDKIEKKRDNKEDYTMDLLALKQYIKRDDVRKEVGASEIRNLVSPLIK